MSGRRTRRLGVLLLGVLLSPVFAAPPVGGTLPDTGAVQMQAAPPPAGTVVDMVPAPAQGTTTTTVPPYTPAPVVVSAGPVDPAAPWWQNPAVITAILAVPTSILTALFAHKQGMKRAEMDASAQRDSADLTAINTRDKAFGDLLTMLTSQQAQRDPLISENAALKTRLEVVEQRQREREEREREQIAKIATLEAKTQDFEQRQKHLDACAGGAPCPLAHLRRTT